MIETITTFKIKMAFKKSLVSDD